MIIDKDKVFLKWLEEILALAGYDVHPSDSEDLSSGKIFRINPKVCLLGFDKKEINGFFLSRQLCVQEEKEISFIAMASSDSIRECKKLIKICRLDGYLLRPFMPLDVIAAIEMFLTPKFIEPSNEDFADIAEQRK